jgi:hypothetical protein
LRVLRVLLLGEDGVSGYNVLDGLPAPRAAVFSWQFCQCHFEEGKVALRHRVIERGGVGAAEAERLVVGGERLAQARRAVFIGQRRKVLEEASRDYFAWRRNRAGRCRVRRKRSASS